eukprot:CAMPEP_0174819530 /NCGR_PEP_ID=MMETSP1107-20130205/2821_1 /TAXON_ID=36770 /ORGANISM="Paraphysomonas vestita, Strain GFlagA" /LENGTH=196 /DNA_ID=CAMNT_0016033205 /DNA_START=47 /DNA_END=634 /DNA_ORIENTATION=+
MTELVVRGDIEETLGNNNNNNNIPSKSSPTNQNQKVLPLRQMPHDQPGSSKASMFSTRPGKDLAWNNINFIVNKKTQVLNNCWGEVPHGKVCAILGPSGAGKSSLLNVLAGRSASAPGIDINGKITVDGVEIDPVSYRKNIAYVMQDDALMATTTPREALRFSAALRRNDVTLDEINELVEATLKALGIDECADTW